jgi:hypothetical protein
LLWLLLWSLAVAALAAAAFAAAALFEVVVFDMTGVVFIAANAAVVKHSSSNCSGDCCDVVMLVVVVVVAVPCCRCRCPLIFVNYLSLLFVISVSAQIYYAQVFFASS